MPGSSLSESWQDVDHRNVTYLQQSRSRFQCINCFPCCAEDAKHFQPKQELLLQEVMESGGDCRCAGGVFVNEVFVPRLASIL